MREYNFIYAIEHNEVQQYLLGEGKYFIPQVEYCNRPLHDYRRTSNEIRSCIAEKLINEQKTYDIIDDFLLDKLYRSVISKGNILKDWSDVDV